MRKKINYHTQLDILMSYRELIENVRSLNPDSNEKGRFLKRKVDQFINSHWYESHTEDLIAHNFDFTEISRLHKTLIKETMRVLKNESSVANELLLENEINVSAIIDKVENEKLAHGIYLFSKSESEVEYIIIGDIHSDESTVVKLLDQLQFYQKVAMQSEIKLIFMGDYIDRGKAHLKTMERILLLKILFPNHIYLLRGNHDGGKFTEEGTIKLPYRIPDQDILTDYFPKYLEYLMLNDRGVDKALIEDYFALFDALPYIAFIQTEKGVVQCVHGGIPKPYFGNDNLANIEPFDFIETLSMLTAYPELDNTGATILENQMWSDPYDGEGDYRLVSKRFKFGIEHFKAYASRVGIWKLLRGHEARREGYEINHDGRVYTIFSSGNSEDSHYNTVNPCYASVSFNGEIIITHIV